MLPILRIVVWIRFPGVAQFFRTRSSNTTSTRVVVTSVDSVFNSSTKPFTSSEEEDVAASRCKIHINTSNFEQKHLTHERRKLAFEDHAVQFKFTLLRRSFLWSFSVDINKFRINPRLFSVAAVRSVKAPAHKRIPIK